MLLTKFINIIMNRGNLGYYNRVMNKKYKVGDSDDIPMELIPKTMNVDVDVECDICKSKMIKNYKTYNSCLEYGFYSCNKCKHIKRKMTSKEKHGDENFNNIDKRKDTMSDRYGFYNNNREKSKNTCIDKYGEDNVSKVYSVKNKKKETNNKNWGVDNVFQSDEIKRRSDITMFKNHGVNRALQNIDLFNKAQISGFKIKRYKDIGYYRGKYELDFLEYCDKNNIIVVNGPSVKYIYNDVNKVYHSDFYIKNENLICEIKSSYTYNYNKELNDAKRKSCIENGYNFLFIIDKDYSELDKIINK